MKRTINVMLVILIAFSLLSVLRTYTAQTTPTPTQPVHNINTGLNYTTIQAAIDAPETLDGHTLRCDAGNYTENVHVYKSLKIIGAGPTLTYRIPFEPNDTFFVTANTVTVEGFTIQSVSGYCGVSAYKADNCGILNNVFTGNGGGILLRSSNDNTVSSNEIDSLPGDGITLTDSSQGNKILSNSLNRNHYGIQVRNASNYNVIANNLVNSSTVDGIRLNWQGSNYAPVAFNNITNNIICYNHDGIFLDYPSSNNLVSDNMASDNTIGIRLRQTNSSTVVRNTVISNSYLGISAESSYANTIDDNFLNNTANAWDNGVNSWSIVEPVREPFYSNIIGGDFLGGNYWSDNPNLIDLNNDGIGEVPYGIPGGSNKDGLPLVTQLPIFIASFMTPEGEPYPFDITISDGTWRRESTNITHIVTQVPYNASYWYVFNWGDGWRTSHFIDGLSFSAHEIRAFEFYAIREEEVRTRPYIQFQEVGANASLSWNWSSATETLYWNLFAKPGKLVNIEMNPNYNESSPPVYFVNSSYIGGGAVEESGSHSYRHILWCAWCTGTTTNSVVETRNGTGEGYWSFEQIPAGEGGLRIMSLSFNEASMVAGATMEMKNVVTGEVFKPTNASSQHFVVPEGNYILSIADAPWLGIGESACVNLPIQVQAGQMRTIRWFLLNKTDLTPFTFAGAGAENPCTKAPDIKIPLFGQNKITFDNVAYVCKFDWWGCFVLPKNRMVRTLIVYSSNASYQLRESYNYTEQIVGDHNIVTVRIPGNLTTEVNNLTLDYIVLENNNAVMDVTPLKTVIGQHYSANTNVTVYCGVPAEPMNITLYVNQTIIGTLTNVTPACGNCTTMTFPWNTTSFAYGNYTICACAWPVPGETDSSDNNFTCCFTVHVGVPGDVSGPTQGAYDGKCDMRDVSYLIIRFNSKPNSANWNPNADINNDGTVNMRDISIAIINFNKHE